MSFDIDVVRRLGGRVVGVRLEAPPGITVLTGPSGVGKTSTLNMVAGLLRPDSGHVRLYGESLFDAHLGIDVPPHHRRLGYVFQDGRLFPHLRVRANLLYGFKNDPACSPVLTFDEIIGFLDLKPLLDRWPRSLSGGEARRVAIGRALLSGARALLMDEPLASLDRARQEEILRIVEKLRDDKLLPILYVTHDMREAERLANHVVEVGRRDDVP